MKSITLKIILYMFIAFIAITLIPRFFFRFASSGEINDIINSNVFAYGMVITTLFALFAFYIIINRIIVHRIKEVTHATTLVSEGEYDITIASSGKDEISKLNRNFNKMAAELMKKENQSKEFLRNFTHEIKTPISTFKGYADLIQEPGMSIEDIRAYAKIISEESTRLTELSTKMLLMSKVDASEIIKHQEKYNLAEQIRQIIQFLQPNWESKHLEFSLSLDSIDFELESIYSYHVFNNLISNAIKYSKDEGFISIVLKDYPDFIYFSIEDNGIGIEQQYLEHIFTPYFTVDSNYRKNTGVGLAIVKKIIDKLNGTITIESKLDEYTKFEIKIKK